MAKCRLDDRCDVAAMLCLLAMAFLKKLDRFPFGLPAVVGQEQVQSGNQRVRILSKELSALVFVEGSPRSAHATYFSQN